MEDRTKISPVIPLDAFEGCKVVAMSDVGRVREENQDFMGYIRHRRQQLIVVADGMGGHSGGFEASRIAVDVLSRTFEQSAETAEPAETLQEGIQAANDAVRQAATSNKLLAGMGTTVVAALIEGGRAWVAHVGDSRCYLVREGKALLLTLDHSRLFRMLESGMITSDQLDDHPMGHILERSVGADENLEVGVCDAPVVLQRGDRLVLCSDGLWSLVEDAEVAEVFEEVELQSAVERVIGMALARGADDNTTVAAAEIIDGPESAPAVRDVRTLFSDDAPVLSASPAADGRVETSKPSEERKTQTGWPLMASVFVIGGLLVLAATLAWYFSDPKSSKVEEDPAASAEGTAAPSSDETTAPGGGDSSPETNSNDESSEKK